MNMDKAEKRRLKKLGKELVEKQSKELADQLAQTNPANFASDEYLQNEIEIRRKEKELRVSPKVRSADDIRKNFIVRTLYFNLYENFEVSLEKYWECRSCGDFVPSFPTINSICSCKNIEIEICNDFELYRSISKLNASNVLISIPVYVDEFEIKFFTAKFRDEGKLRLVSLLGKVEAGDGKKKWWQFWSL